MKSPIITFLILIAAIITAPARSNRIYFDGEALAAGADSTLWIAPYHNHLLNAAFEIRGASAAEHTRIDILWSYDSIADAPIHTASFRLSEPSDGIYGSNAPTMEVSIDGNVIGHLDSGIASRKGDNSIAVEFDFANSTVTALAGSSYLTPFASAAIPDTAEGIRFGVRLPGRWVTDMAVTSYAKDPAYELVTGLTEAAIDSLIAASPQSPAGYWRYLDRDCNPDYARPGGNYTLAIVPDAEPDSYLILYLEGAQTAASRWHPGMIKGRLKGTPFEGHYDLVWYDAELSPHSSECSATLEQPIVLRLDFPLLKASLRLARLTHR